MGVYERDVNRLALIFRSTVGKKEARDLAPCHDNRILLALMPPNHGYPCWSNNAPGYKHLCIVWDKNSAEDACKVHRKVPSASSTLGRMLVSTEQPLLAGSPEGLPGYSWGISQLLFFPNAFLPRLNLNGEVSNQQINTTSYHPPPMFFASFVYACRPGNKEPLRRLFNEPSGKAVRGIARVVSP